MRDREADFSLETPQARRKAIDKIARQMNVVPPSDAQVARWTLPAVAWSSDFRFAVEERIAYLEYGRERMRVGRVPIDRTAFVYFVAGAGLIKIGTAKVVRTRLRDLQIGSPVRLELLVAIRGSRHLEMLLHQRFEHLHAHGEWFRAEHELRAFIDEMRRRQERDT